MVLQQNLDFIERRIKPETLQLFKESGKTWNGDIEFKQFFTFWKDLVNESSLEILSNNINDMNLDTSYPEIDESFWLKHNDVSDFHVQPDGELVPAVELSESPPKIK